MGQYIIKDILPVLRKMNAEYAPNIDVYENWNTERRR